MYANAAVNCLDLPPAFSAPAGVQAALPEFDKASPVFGRGFAWASLNCAYWPVPATGKPHRIEAKGADPIVVVGTTRDPATPYKWAQGLAGAALVGHAPDVRRRRPHGVRAGQRLRRHRDQHLPPGGQGPAGEQALRLTARSLPEVSEWRPSQGRTAVRPRARAWFGAPETTL